MRSRKPGSCLAKSTISCTEIIASSVKWAKRCCLASRLLGSGTWGHGCRDRKRQCVYVKDGERAEEWEDKVNREKETHWIISLCYSQNVSPQIQHLKHLNSPKMLHPQPQLPTLPLFLITVPLVRVITVTLSLSVNERWLHCCWAATSFSIMLNCWGVSLWEGLGGCGGFGRTTTVRAWSSSCFFSFFSRICSSDRTSKIEMARDQPWHRGMPKTAQRVACSGWRGRDYSCLHLAYQSVHNIDSRQWYLSFVSPSFFHFKLFHCLSFNHTVLQNVHKGQWTHEPPFMLPCRCQKHISGFSPWVIPQNIIL